MALATPAPSGTRVRVAIAVFIAILLLAGKLAGGFDAPSRWAFDFASTVSPPRPAEPSVVIVAIDEPSFSAIGKPWPWPRQLHAQLIDQLRLAGARVVAFDIVFAEPTEGAADADLAAAADTRTIFGADETVASTPQGTMLLRTEPLESLLAHGAKTATTSVRLDRDGVVRVIPSYADSLPRQILRARGAPAASAGRGDRLIQYFGGPRTYPYISYYQALDPKRFLPPDLLKGRDVIVGFTLQATAEGERGADLFETAYTRRTGQLTPGAEIHAAIVDNLRHRLWIAPVPNWLAIVALFAGCAIGFLASLPNGLVTRVACGVAAAAAIVAISWLALRFGRMWISPIEPLAGLIATASAVGIADFAAERQNRSRIQQIFGQYVAPAVVKRIIEDPAQVKLGGERKEITTLFVDVRGFTSIAEALKDQPETLTQLVTEILTPLSEIVTRNGGTIDKYIGDCLMAFWNAPFDDPDHASRAISAAIEMIEAMRVVDETARRQSLAGTDFRIAVGIGINTGDCIVGNMGSHERFDYTVVGDPVNVASRLEGLCKVYQVPMIVGAATVAMASDEYDFVIVDRIQVRGTTRLQTIYTLEQFALTAPAAPAPSVQEGS